MKPKLCHFARLPAISLLAGLAFCNADPVAAQTAVTSENSTARQEREIPNNSHRNSGQQSAQDKLGELAVAMKSLVDQMARETELSRDTIQKQTDMVAKLRRLIDEIASERAPPAAVPQPDSGDRDVRGGDQEGASGGQTERPLELPDDSIPQTSATAGDFERQLIDRAWGSLPSEVRERLKTGAPPQFLPKYDAMIRAYYRRMAK